VAWLRELGLRHVEVSDGTIALDAERKREIVEQLSKEFVVFSEVGSKDDERIMAPYRWVEEIERELAAGAWKVVAEARESGTAGIFRPDGEVRMGLIDEIAHAVDPERPEQRSADVLQRIGYIDTHVRRSGQSRIDAAIGARSDELPRLVSIRSLLIMIGADSTSRRCRSMLNSLSQRYPDSPQARIAARTIDTASSEASTLVSVIMVWNSSDASAFGSSIEP